MSDSNQSLSPEQVENWRGVLLRILGPYALIMPVEKIEAFRDLYQSRLDEFSSEEATAPDQPTVGAK